MPEVGVPLPMALHRLRMCPLCGNALRMLIETDVIRLYCFPHGTFELRYSPAGWNVEYKFPEILTA